MSIIINEDGLFNEDINERNSKARALLFDENSNLLVANYGGVLLLPGGSIDENESIEEALIRELNEELGVPYSKEELSYLNTIDFYQREYPKRDGSVKNRLVTTHFYTGMYKGINKQSLTEKEKKDNFTLDLMPIDKLEELLNNKISTNLREHFFRRELAVILGYYRRKSCDKSLKKE